MAQPPINPKVLAALKAVAAAKRKPIVVTNPNDPRLKAYQDSARLYNANKAIYDKEKPPNATYKDVEDAYEYGQLAYTPKGAAFRAYDKPKQPVVYQKPAPRTPAVVPAKIPIKLAPTNFVAPLPATPATQPVAVAPPSQPVPVAKPAGVTPALWAPGQRYSIKDEKVRRMLKAIQSLKRQ